MITLNPISQVENSSAPLRLAVFDCDGTLVDSGHSIVHCMQAACVAQGCDEPSPEDVRHMVGLPLEDAIAGLYPYLSSDKVMAVRESYRDVFIGLREKGEVHEPLYHGARDALNTLDQAGWLLGVATGKGFQGLVSTLDTHDLKDRFVTLQTADRALGKPNPDMLHKALAETGAEASTTVMIGDTTYDMEMARNAGTLAVGVAWGYHDVDMLRRAGAHRVVDRYDMLAEVMESLMGTTP